MAYLEVNDGDCGDEWYDNFPAAGKAAATGLTV